MNMHRPAVSSVDQRLDICDSVSAPTRPSLSTVEMEDRDTSVSWAAADGDGCSVLLLLRASSPSVGGGGGGVGGVNILSFVVIVVGVTLTGVDGWSTLPDDAELRYRIPIHIS